MLLPVTGLSVAAEAADPKPAASTGAPVPDPVTGLYPGQYVPATATSPAKAGWVTGTKTYDTGVVSVPVAAARPAAPAGAAKPARPAGAHAAPVAPAAVPAALPFTSGEATTGSHAPSIRSRGTTAGQPTTLPFTGPTRLPLELSLAGVLLLLGGLLQRAARHRPAQPA